MTQSSNARSGMGFIIPPKRGGLELPIFPTEPKRYLLLPSEKAKKQTVTLLLTSALKHSKGRMRREIPHYFNSSKIMTRAIFYLVCTYILTYLGYNMWSHVVCSPSILVAFITPVELSAKHFHTLNCCVRPSSGWVNFQLLLIKLNIRLYSHQSLKI